MSKCVFCDNPELTVIWQNQDFQVIQDISPKAKTHWLLIPKKHILDINSVEDPDMLKTMKQIAVDVFHHQGKVDSLFGFHIPPFTSVGHLHLHMLEKPLSFLGKVAFPLSVSMPWFKTIDQSLDSLLKSSNE